MINLHRVFLFAMLVLFVRCSTPSIVATQSIRKGDEMNNLNRYEEAIKSYEEYLTLSPQLGIYRNVSMEAEVCRKLGHAYATQGRYKQALRYLNRALATDSTIATNGLELVEDYRQIGLVNAYSGNYKEALKNLEISMHLNRGMEKSSKSIKQSSVADTHLALAQLNLTLGNYREAQYYAHYAWKLYSKLSGEYTGIMESLLVLGIVARDRGNLQEAVEFFESSQKIAEQERMNTSRHYQALAEVYSLKGELQNSIRYKLLALEQAEKSNIKPQIIIAYMRLGDVYQQLGDEEKANQNYRKALEIQSQMAEGDTVAFLPSATMRQVNVQQAYTYYMQSGSTIGAGLVSLRLGEVMYGQGNLDSAQLLFEQAKRAFDKAGSAEGKAKSNLELAKVLTTKKEYQKARELLAEATQQTIQPDLKWQIHYRTGIILAELGQIAESRSQYEISIGIIDKMRANLTVDDLKTSFFNIRVDVYDRLILLLLNNKDRWKDLTAQEAIVLAYQMSERARSRTFLDMLGNQKVKPKNQADTVLLSEEQLLRIKMQRLVQEINKAEDNSQFVAELEQAQERYEGLMEKVKLQNAEYASVISVSSPTVAEIQSALKPQAAMLEYWVSTNTLVIWIITKKGVEVRLVPVAKKDLLRQISIARRGINMQLETAQQALTTLYKHLVEPVESSISSYKNLIIVPHGSLHFLPYQALTTAAGNFLIERYIISYAPSASVYYYCTKKEPPQGNSFLGAALGDSEIGEFSGLPGTALELNQLAGLYEKFEKHLQNDFNETNFKERATGFNYIHIATHGVLNKVQPLYSYLLMKDSPKDDGRLTVNEIFGLEVNSKIVTLSACETGLGELGEADELVGLSRAFIYAGTPSVVVSLWKVDDATTAWLMARFNQYLSAGYGSGESITYAQRDLLQRNFTSTKIRGGKNIVWDDQLKAAVSSKPAEVVRNPYFWAPFILIGNDHIN